MILTPLKPSDLDEYGRPREVGEYLLLGWTTLNPSLNNIARVHTQVLRVFDTSNGTRMCAGRDIFTATERDRQRLQGKWWRINVDLADRAIVQDEALERYADRRADDFPYWDRNQKAARAKLHVDKTTETLFRQLWAKLCKRWNGA